MQGPRLWLRDAVRNSCNMDKPISETNERWRGTLPDALGMVHVVVEPGHVQGHFEIEKRHMAANGYLHAASIVALVDSACGIGALTMLPDGATGFTTIEIKTNLSGHGARRRRALRGAHDSWRTHDAGVGRDCQARAKRKSAGALSLHADAALSPIICATSRKVVLALFQMPP